MMYAIPFHHMIVGLSAGAGTLMGICAILAWLSNRVSNLESSKSTLDKASYAASILTLVTLPLAMFSGYYSVSDPTGSAIFYNKFIFSKINTTQTILGKTYLTQLILNPMVLEYHIIPK